MDVNFCNDPWHPCPSGCPRHTWPSIKAIMATHAVSDCLKLPSYRRPLSWVDRNEGPALRQAVKSRLTHNYSLTVPSGAAPVTGLSLWHRGGSLHIKSSSFISLGGYRQEGTRPQGLGLSVHLNRVNAFEMLYWADIAFLHKHSLYSTFCAFQKQMLDFRGF